MPFMRGLVPRHERNIHRSFGMAPFLGAPAPDSFGVLPKSLQMWGNSTYGDCVTAEECASKAMYSVMRGAPELLIPDSVCVSWARSHGYLNGADLTSVMDDMAKDGITVNGQTYRDGAPQSVDWTNFSVLGPAIFQGPIKIAVSANQLEGAGAGNQNGWVLSGARRDLNTDHCVGLWGYGTAQQLADMMNKDYGISVSLGSLSPQTPSVYLYTWSTVGIVEHRSLVAITDEAYLRTPTTVPDYPVPTPTPTPTPGPTPGPNPPLSGTFIIDLGSRTIAPPGPGWTLVPVPLTPTP